MNRSMSHQETVLSALVSLTKGPKKAARVCDLEKATNYGFVWTALHNGLQPKGLAYKNASGCWRPTKAGRKLAREVDAVDGWRKEAKKLAGPDAPGSLLGRRQRQAYLNAQRRKATKPATKSGKRAKTRRGKAA